MQSTLSSYVYSAPQISHTSLKCHSSEFRFWGSYRWKLICRKTRMPVSKGAGCEDLEDGVTAEMRGYFRTLLVMCMQGLQEKLLLWKCYCIFLLAVLFFHWGWDKLVGFPLSAPSSWKHPLLWQGSTSNVHSGLPWGEEHKGFLLRSHSLPLLFQSAIFTSGVPGYLSLVTVISSVLPECSKG